jgi:hypothetical protein
MNSNPILLPIFYLPSIAWFSVFLKFENEILLEQMEHFPKQTYRNRTEIMGANGKLTLSIPVKKHGKIPIKDIEISFTENWKAQHWKSIQSAYQSSPYFEFYKDKLFEIYNNDIHNLVEFNSNALTIILKLLKIEKHYSFTNQYDVVDAYGFRTFFSSKKTIHYNMESYFQVFSDKFPFMENLSILDLICNMGPESATYIKKVSQSS